MRLQISVLIGHPGCGKTTTIGTWCARAAARYGHDRVIVSSLTRTAAHHAARNIELPYQQFGTVHGFAHRALGQPTVAESKLTEWNEAYPAFTLSGSGQAKNPDDGYLMPEESTAADAAKLMYSKLRTMHVPRTAALWHTAALEGFATRWEDWKAQNHYTDFNDMLQLALDEIDAAPGEPAVILGDEWQDVGNLEMAVIMKWAQKAEHLVVVGDPGQAIFSWRGSNPLLLQELRAEHDPHRAPFHKSYRLPRAVCNYAHTWQKRFRQTFRVEYGPRTDPVDSDNVVEGWVRTGGLPFNRHTPETLLQLVEEFTKEGLSVMFQATCGYMLDHLVHCLRESGTPFFNPLRPNNGKWNPLPQKRSRGLTIVDRVLAFSRPRPDLWGDQARFWTAGDIKAWVGGLPSTGILTRGGQAKVQALPDDATDETISEGFAAWFIPETLKYIAPRPDVAWYMEKVKGKENFRDFVSEIITRRGVKALQEKPKITIGTVHSLKGSEADVVVISPDLSLEAYTAACADREAAEELTRVFYVGLTRARTGLVLAEASNRNAVRW